MKKLLIILILFSLATYGQITNTKNLRIANATTEFGENIPIGTQVYNIATGELWVATSSVVSTATLTTASESFNLINSDDMVYPDAGIALSTGTAWGTSITNNSANWNNTYNWGYSAAIVLNQSATNLFAYPHATMVVDDVLFVSEQVYNGKIFRFPDLDDLTTYTSVQIPGENSYGGMSHACYNSTTDKIYFSTRKGSDYSLNIIEVDPDNLSTYTIHNISSITSINGTLPICTDGSYIYGSTYVNSGSSTLFKIAVSDWTVSTTNSWTNGASAHACKCNSNRNQFYITTSFAGNYMAIVSTADLSYSEVNFGTYANRVSDDICFYDDGTTCNVFAAGEYNVENYGGVMVTTTSGNALTGINLKPSYGLFIKDKVIYSCGSGGYVQVFSVDNIKNISTFVFSAATYGSINEFLITSNNRTFATNYYMASSVRLMEIYFPSTNSQNVTLSGAQTITGSKTFSSDVNMVGFNVTDENNTEYAAKIINESTFNTSGGLLVGTGGITAGADILTLTDYAQTTIFNFDNDGKFRMKEDDTSPTVPSGFGTFLAKTDGKIYFKNDSQTEYDLTGGGGSLWSEDTYGITYSTGNVGIGAASSSAYDLYVGGPLYTEDQITSMRSFKLYGYWNSMALQSYGYGVTWIDSDDQKLKFTNNTTTYDLTAGGGSSTFIGLDDTPSSYTGQAGKWLKVNATATALEFTDAPSGGGVTSVAAGDGMDFTTITSTGSVTLGTPSSITTSSTNSLTTTSHTHALDLSGRSVLTQYSLTGGGNLGSDRTLNLVGDVASPGNSKYYGTNVSGTRGFYDLPTGSGPNVTVQTLSGTAPGWNMSNGINGKITLSGNTTITLSNVPSGYSGNLTVTNASTAYTIQFSGYTFKISPYLNSSSGVITMSGGSVVDMLSWYYDGTYVIINGAKDYD